MELRTRRAGKTPTQTIATRKTQRTSLNLPMELVREAQKLLGTATITSTVIRSMQEAIRLRLRLRLLERDFPDLTLEAVEEMRRARLPEIRQSSPARRQRRRV